MHVVTIWSDIGCPWSYVACLRLHRMRDRLGADDVDFDFRSRPRERSDTGPVTLAQIRHEMAALAQLEHTAFAAFTGRWPSTFMPALEAQKWGYALSQDAGEQFDLALRRAVFLHGHDVSNPRELVEVATAEGFEGEALLKALDRGVHRGQVADDLAASDDVDVEGTPVVVLPDGMAHANPGMTVEWRRGLPLIMSDHPGVYEEIIRSAAMLD